MSKTFISMFTLVAGLGYFSVSSLAATPTRINFGIDCMIHDNHGKMLADLGMVGAMMGSYMPEGKFEYNGLKIEANLNGPFAATPEVSSPQMQLTVTDPHGATLAALVTSAKPDTNVALFIPGENVYLHCDQMNM